MLRSPIMWFGGKGNIVKWILGYIPEHDYYLEVFGGGGSLLFAKPKSDFEVYNDIDEGLYCLFSVLRDPDKFKKFLNLACMTPYSRCEYKHMKEKWRKGDFEDDIDRAYTFWYIAYVSFSGTFGHSISMSVASVHRHFPSTVSRYLSKLKLLPDIHARIMSVQIECLDFRKCIEKYVRGWDYKNSLIYCDPPYVKSTRKKGGYTYEMTDDDHNDLVDLLIKYENKCKFILSGYHNEIYERLEKRGWNRVSRAFGCFAVGRTRHNGILGDGIIINNKEFVREECLWMNYDIHGDQTKLFY